MIYYLWKKKKKQEHETFHNKTYTSLLQHMFFNYKNMLKKTDIK